jgi:hypothetical protein
MVGLACKHPNAFNCRGVGHVEINHKISTAADATDGDRGYIDVDAGKESSASN